MAKEKRNKESHGNLFWKGVALAFVAVFCAIVIFGLVRLNHSEPHRIAANPSQVELAKSAVAKDLSISGENISDYKIQISDMARGFAREGQNKNIIQVSLYDSSRRYLYLVDADSGDIVMRSETDFYGWMENQTHTEPPRAGPGPFFGR